MTDQAETELLDQALMRELEDRFGREAMAALVETYLQESENRLRQVPGLVAANDVAALGQQAHDLTTSAGTIGVKAVYLIARDIEYACKSGQPAAALALAGRLPRIAELCAAALRARFPEVKL
jgi:HPt (histidine-containing phosphotransfer) domain-containing protein